MLEVYRAYANYEDMMQLCQDLISAVSRELFKGVIFSFKLISEDSFLIQPDASRTKVVPLELDKVGA
jgi:lysyl-tRNA synthetase class II